MSTQTKIKVETLKTFGFIVTVKIIQNLRPPFSIAKIWLSKGYTASELNFIGFMLSSE